MSVVDYGRTAEYCNRKEITLDNWERIADAQLVLGVARFGDVPLPGPGIHDQREAHELLGTYIDELGIRYFSGDEVTTPNHRDKASALGWSYLVPPTYLWPWVGLVLRVSDILRESVGRAVRLRNLWRPLDYNRAVRGSAKGDHPDACGVDLDFSSSEDQRVAEGVVRSLYDREELGLSVGLGRRSLHVGVLSSRGRRRWFYGSATPDQRRGFRGPTYRTIE